MERTDFLWNELTILWNDLTIDWKEYMEQSTANSNSFKIAQKTAFEVKGRLY